MKKIGFIGCGKMATAIINGVLNSNLVENADIIASKSSENNLEELKNKLKVDVVLDNKIVAKNSEVIILAIKPHFINEVLEEIKACLNENQLIISIAAGFKIENIEKVLPKNPVVRVMPNAPLMYLEGASGIALGKNVTEQHKTFVLNLFESLGKCCCVEESQMDIVTAVAGSSPAFFFKYIEEMARAAEKMGLDYQKSLILTAQTALGSAKMVLESGLTVDELIKIITTKGGCTEVGVNYLNEIDLKTLSTNLVEKTAKKASELG